MRTLSRSRLPLTERSALCKSAGVSSRQHHLRSASRSSQAASARRRNMFRKASKDTTCSRKSGKPRWPRTSTHGRTRWDRSSQSRRSERGGTQSQPRRCQGRLSSERSRQVPMKQQEPIFSIEKGDGGILRIVITRPDGSQIVMPDHSGRPDQVRSPPIACLLERDHPRDL